MKYVPVLLAFAILSSACEQAPAPQPDSPNKNPSQATAKPAVQAVPAASSLPRKTEQKPPALDLTLPEDHAIVTESAGSERDRKKQKLMPDLFAEANEQRVELDGSIKLREQPSQRSPSIDGVELQLKSRF